MCNPNKRNNAISHLRAHRHSDMHHLARYTFPYEYIIASQSLNARQSVMESLQPSLAGSHTRTASKTIGIRGPRIIYVKCTKARARGAGKLFVESRSKLMIRNTAREEAQDEEEEEEEEEGEEEVCAHVHTRVRLYEQGSCAAIRVCALWSTFPVNRRIKMISDCSHSSQQPFRSAQNIKKRVYIFFTARGYVYVCATSCSLCVCESFRVYANLTIASPDDYTPETPDRRCSFFEHARGFKINFQWLAFILQGIKGESDRIIYMYYIRGARSVFAR